MKADKIAVFLPTSNPKDAALLRATDLARATPGCTIDLVDVLPRLRTGLLSAIIPDSVRAETQARDARLQELQALKEEELGGGSQIRVQVETGSTAVELVRTVLRDGHDVILKASRNRGSEDATLGTVAMRLVRACPCPVWIVAPRRPGRNTIIAAVNVDTQSPDQAALNRRILRSASWLAELDAAPLQVVFALDIDRALMGVTHADGAHLRRVEAAALEEAEARLESAVEDAGLDPKRTETRILLGRPRDTLVKAARKEAGVLVMGTVGRSGIAGYMVGNTAEGVLRRVDCSVLALKPPSFVSPIEPDDR